MNVSNATNAAVGGLGIAPKNPPVSDTLMYHGGFNAETVAKMKESRKSFLTLAREVEATIAPSRERSLCLTAIEQAQMYAMKAICLAAPEAVKEDPFA